MKYKIKGTYYVTAPSWIEAEKQVEQGLVEADSIQSEPLSKAPRDIVQFGIASKIYDLHFELFFKSNDDEEYNKKVDTLKKQTITWLENIVEDIININEQEWI